MAKLVCGHKIGRTGLEKPEQVWDMRSKSIRSLLPLILAVLLVTSGCAQLLSWKQIKLKTMPAASEDHPVYEVICLWEPGEGTGLDGLPSRGFVGKIMFFAHGIDPPVRVTDGEITLYVFDDQGTPEEQEKPLHQFRFDATAFQNFLVESNLGAAYQLFIPYTRPGVHRANCSLRVKVASPTGKPVYSKMASVILPGKVTRQPEKPVTTATPSEKNEGIQLVTHEEPASRVLGNSEGSSVSTFTSDPSDKTRLMSMLRQATETNEMKPVTQVPALKPLPSSKQDSNADESADSQQPSTTSLRLKPAATKNEAAGAVEVQKNEEVGTSESAAAEQKAPQTNPLAEPESPPAMRHPLQDG